MSFLQVRDLSVTFSTPDGTVQAVNAVNFDVAEGKTLAIVGESGSGKSQTVFAMMGLLASNGQATGSVLFDGQEILGLSQKDMNSFRADKMAMIFQDPMTSLNPYLRVSDQMAEVLTYHKGMSKSAAIKEAVQMLDAVKIPEAKSRITMYPHEFSGGMRQRVMIAMSLLCRPKLLIADEPTTALDVTVQAQIMKLLSDVQKEFGTAIILITHDLGVVAGAADDTLVLYGGQVMEQADTGTLFDNPTHPYTRGLLSAVPRLDHADAMLETIPGNPPNMMLEPKGCPFADRCTHVRETCRETMPPLVAADGDNRHWRACHVAVEDVK